MKMKKIVSLLAFVSLFAAFAGDAVLRFHPFYSITYSKLEDLIEDNFENFSEVSIIGLESYPDHVELRKTIRFTTTFKEYLKNISFECVFQYIVHDKGFYFSKCDPIPNGSYYQFHEGVAYIRHKDETLTIRGKRFRDHHKYTFSILNYAEYLFDSEPQALDDVFEIR